MRTAVSVVSVLVWLLHPPGAGAQEARFASALDALNATLAGTFGDEALSLQGRLDELSESLAAWDRAMADRATALRARLPTADPSEAAHIHETLGADLLQRSRLPDALAAFEEGRQHDPESVRLELLRAFTLEALGRQEEAALGFARAWMLDPGDAAAAYLALTRSAPDGPSAERMRDTLNRAQREAVRDLGPAAVEPLLGIDATGAAAELPAFPLALYAGAFALHLDGRYAEGLAALRRSALLDPLVRDPAAGTEAMRQASAALREGALPAAVESLRVLLTRVPDSSEAHRILATAYDLSGALGKKVEHLEAAVRLRPDDERSWIELTRARARAGDPQEAVRTAERALMSVPDSGELHWQLGNLLLTLENGGVGIRLENGGVAMTHYEQAARLPTLAGGGRLQGMIADLAFRLQDLDRARRAVEARLRLEPASPAAHRELATIHTAQGRHDLAFTELALAAWLDPGDAQTLSALGLNHLARGRNADAVDALERAVTLRPELREARSALGQALIRVGRRDEAREHLAEFGRLHAAWLREARLALERNGLERQAALQSATGEHARAAETLLQVIALQPDETRHYLDLADAQTAAGQLDRALQSLVRAAELDGVAEVHLRIAELLARMGRNAESALARETYARLRLEDLRRGNP